MSFEVKNTTFFNIIDMLCPHTCRGCGAIGAPLCARCKKNLIYKHRNYCPKCKNMVRGGKCEKCTGDDWLEIFMVGWREDVMMRLVHDFKYNSVRALGRELAELIDAILPKLRGEVKVVPLPTTSRHVRKRGLDHTLILAKRLAKRRGWKAEQLLERAKDTVQVGADAVTRQKQASEAYRAKGKVDDEAIYVLIDDVWTTGASMMAGVRELRGAGAKKIIATVLAVNRRDGYASSWFGGCSWGGGGRSSGGGGSTGVLAGRKGVDDKVDNGKGEE